MRRPEHQRHPDQCRTQTADSTLARTLLKQRDRLAKVVRHLLEHGQWFPGAIESKRGFDEVGFDELEPEAQAVIDEIDKGGQ